MTTPDLPTGLIDAVDTSPFGMCIMDAMNQKFIYLNYAFAPILGCYDIINPGESVATLLPEAILQFIQSQTQRSFDYDCELALQDGRVRWIRIHVEEINHKNHPYQALWIHDITPIIESEQKNAESLKVMEQLAIMKSNLLATMSHEIRTPMQAVFGYLELIAEEKPEQKILDMVSTARASASDLLEILDDVLDLAKLDADKMELDEFEIPLRTLCYGVIESLEVKKFGQDVALKLDVDDDVPSVIAGDPKRLRQVLINLMGNSLKFTKRGAITVHINTKCEHITATDDQKSIRFEIIDTGIGMSEDTCHKLFSPFAQADNSTTREFGGTGLGLSICKKLVDLMGGEIGVYSKEGMGSTFWFEIPTYEITDQSPTINLPKLDGLAILVVEDHPKAIIEITNSLRSMGAEVEACDNYHDATDLAKQRPFDAAVIDHNLPDGYGLNLIKDISDIQPNCGLLMYTVHDDYMIQNALRAIGARHLAKPASRIGLGEAVQSVVKQRTTMTIDGPHKILIAEDTESVRHILLQQMEKLGLSPDFVENGVEAFKAYETGEYGVIISDLHMPEMDGYQLVNAIREAEKDNDDKRTPVIVLTADVQMGQRQVYIKHGFDECLLKPVSLAQVKRLMMRWGVLGDDAHPHAPEVTNDTADIKITNDTGDNAIINLDDLTMMMGDLDDDTHDMLAMFITMTDPVIEELKQAFDHKNWKEFSEVGHSLKGSARSIGANILGNICATIQDEGQTMSDGDRAIYLDKVITAYVDVDKEIQRLKTDGFPQ